MAITRVTCLRRVARTDVGVWVADSFVIKRGTLLRVLAVSSDERVEGIDAPTLKESGIDLTFANWRGVLAPPGISDDAKQVMVKVLEELHGTQQWKKALVKNGWTDAFMTGAPFEQFLKDQDNRVSSTLTELGLV